MAEMTNTELASMIEEFVAEVSERDELLYLWQTGTATGGPNGDGLYPLMDFTGFTRLVACPEKIASIAATTANDIAGPLAASAIAIMNGKIFATTTAAISNGVLDTSGLVAGTGGTNGTFSLTFTGGGGTGAAGYFIVSGGAVTKVVVTASGSGYTSAPAVTMTGSTGLTGASVTAVIGPNVAEGGYFMLAVSGSTSLPLYKKISGAAVSQNLAIPTQQALTDTLTSANNVVATAAASGSRAVTQFYNVSNVLGMSAIFDLKYWRTTMFQDSAATVPVTASGQPVGCIRNMLGDTNLDLVQTDNTKRPSFQIIDGMPQVYCAAGTGLISRSTISPTGATSVIGAFQSTGVLATVFGVAKTGTAYAVLTSEGLSRIRFHARGASAWIISQTPFYSAHSGSMQVSEGYYDSANVGVKIFNGDEDPLYSPKVNTNNMDTALAGGRIVLNYNETLVVQGTLATTFYGGAIMSGVSGRQAGLVNYFSKQLEPELRTGDIMDLVIGDSTGDDVATATGSFADELFLSHTRNARPVLHPNSVIYYRNWSINADQFNGWMRLSVNGNATQRVFVSNLSASGQTPGFVLSNRWKKFILDKHPRLDNIIINHGHNLINTSGADTAGYAYRGEYASLSDALRVAYPTTPQFWIRVHPRRSDEGMVPAVAAMDALRAQYGDVGFADIYTHFMNAGRPVGWYAADGVHLAVPDGVDQQRIVFDAAWSSWVRPTIVAAPLLGIVSETLLSNEHLDDWTNGVPTGWTKAGTGTVVRSVEQVDTALGDTESVRIFQPVTSSANSTNIWRTLDAVPYRGQELVLATRAYNKKGGGSKAGNIIFTSDGTDPANSFFAFGTTQFEGWKWVYNFIKVPANATILTIRMFASNINNESGDVFIGRSILVTGNRPGNLRW